MNSGIQTYVLYAVLVGVVCAVLVLSCVFGMLRSTTIGPSTTLLWLCASMDT